MTSAARGRGHGRTKGSSARAVGQRAAQLEARLRRRKVARGDALRAKIVLLAAEGLSKLTITERLGIGRLMVATWRRRVAERRLD